MSTKIKGSECPLSKIFSADYDFEIPSFQRPYAWTEVEAGELFDDLLDFYKDRGKDEQYFLGSIVLVKEDDKPHAMVIDGQQRLTTLTILLAVIASKFSGATRDACMGYIVEHGNILEGVESKPRLQLRARDRKFFAKYIQEMRFEELFALNPNKQDTEAKANIIRNAKLLFDKLGENFPKENDVLNFAMFLVSRCLMVVVSTPTLQAAFRIFTVMNSRGLDLLVTDILKAEIIGKISDNKQQCYTNKWEEMEVALGRSGFNDLFVCIRMINVKEKARRALQEEFIEIVLPDINEQKAMDFIDNTLEPYADAYYAIKKSQYIGTKDIVGEVNDTLKWLNRIDNSDWMPVAMLYYVKYKDDAKAMNLFLRKLERLAAYMRVTSKDVNWRIRRYAEVLKDIENSCNTEYGENIELTDDEKGEFIQCLESDVYTMVGYKRNYLLLRLDSFVADGAAKYDHNILTVEHVLPQTVAPTSE